MSVSALEKVPKDLEEIVKNATHEPWVNPTGDGRYVVFFVTVGPSRSPDGSPLSQPHGTITSRDGVKSIKAAWWAAQTQGN